MPREMLAIQLHRIEADMHEQIDAVIAVQADGMQRREQHRYLAVKRRIELPLRLAHRSAAAHGPTGESRITDLAEQDQLPRQRTIQTNVLHFLSPIPSAAAPAAADARTENTSFRFS